MPYVLAGNWWAIALRGVFGIVLGVTALLKPGIALALLVILFGAYAMADGIFELVSAARTGRHHGRWATLVVYGILGIAAGIVAFTAPLLTLFALVALVAAWGIVTGVLEIAAAIRLRKAIRGEWLMALSGALSVALGVGILFFPFAGALVLALWIGAYMLVAGIVRVVLAFRLRHWLRAAEAGPISGLRAA